MHPDGSGVVFFHAISNSNHSLRRRNRERNEQLLRTRTTPQRIVERVLSRGSVARTSTSIRAKLDRVLKLLAASSETERVGQALSMLLLREELIEALS